MSISRVRPIITLTTDFGLADHYAGTMKGVLLSRCPDAQLVDISHEIPPFSIHSAAYAIDQAARYFPPQTVHVVVVDPGVGTVRKGLCLEALGQFFIAPDNGVLSMIALRDRNSHARELANRDLWLASPSWTFHGRDIFAAVAGAIASGSASPEDAGPFLPHIEMLSGLEPQRMDSGLWSGKILTVDHFGNAITNLAGGDFEYIASAPFAIRCGTHRIETFCRTFGEAQRGICFAYFGSSGYIELGMNQASAAAFLGVSPGNSITLETQR